MCTNHVQAIAWLVFGTNCKSYQCGQIPGEVVSASRLQFPFLLLRQFLKADSRQSPAGFLCMSKELFEGYSRCTFGVETNTRVLIE